MRDKRITEKLKSALQPVQLDVRDISHLHAGHAHGGVETHFSVTVTSPRFQGLSRVAQHQLVNDLLKDEFETGLHALSLKTSAE